MHRWSLLLLLAGCSDDSAPPPESPPGARSITARDALTLVAADGATLAFPTDLDPAVVQAHARTDERWLVYPGEGTSAGTASVGDVPAGASWLRVDYLDTSVEPRPKNEYFFVDSDADVALDLGTWVAGRGGVKYATQAPTEVTFDLSGLAPWQPGLDLAVVYAPNLSFVQVFTQDGEGIEGMPAAGASASQLRVDWATALGGPLLDAGRGDLAYAMQFRFRQVGNTYVGLPVRSTVLPAFTMQDGVATAVPAALTTPPALRARLVMDRDAFDALRPAIGAGAGPAFARGFAIEASPGGDVTQSFSLESMPAEIVVVDGNLSAGGMLDLGEVRPASPFPATSTFTYAASGYPVPLPRDDGPVAQVAAQIGVLTNALPTMDAPVVPIVGPARNVVVEPGLTPQLRWDAPLLGTPTEYEVKILSPGGADPTYDFIWYPSAIFHVPGSQTSIDLPPEILQPDLPFAIAIRAISNASTRTDAPRHIALPYGWADTITQARKP